MPRPYLRVRYDGDWNCPHALVSIATSPCGSKAAQLPAVTFLDLGYTLISMPDLLDGLQGDGKFVEEPESAQRTLPSRKKFWALGLGAAAVLSVVGLVVARPSATSVHACSVVSPNQ